jgi:hypothetical protein
MYTQSSAILSKNWPNKKIIERFGKPRVGQLKGAKWPPRSGFRNYFAGKIEAVSMKEII